MSVNEKHCCCGDIRKDERIEEVKKIIEELRDVRGRLIPLLHGIQGIYGYLPEEILQYASESLDIPMAEIYGVASFYHFFSLEPKGKHVIRVCMGTACYVKGGQAILNRLSQELNIKAGNTTEDRKFTLEATRCVGACGLAPVITIDDKVYSKVTLDDIGRILEEYIEEEG
ncbi:NADH-quinone oxidoreductase subunit NuoE [uncultured Clostridium sp.]|uniref:NADH-quinone oxidoreductase subunit NuoE n=1 Tax=uncultured Clostridium sp. TaxID=59620 RepID=UPI0028E91D43|nr:NADH-quinone oxidoreductase subunit NuoE [uncultured Clostridium sp.]